MSIWWDGGAREETICWTLVRGEQTAVCRLVSFRSRHELRFDVDGEFLLAEECRDEDHAAELQQSWRRVLEAKGWRA